MRTAGWKVGVIAMLLLALLLTDTCQSEDEDELDTAFVGFGGVHTVEQIEAGKFAGFDTKYLPYPLSLLEKRGRIIAGRKLVEFGLEQEWLNLEGVLNKLGETKHYSAHLDPLAKGMDGKDMFAETREYFDPPLPANIPWGDTSRPIFDSSYEGNALLVQAHDGRVTYVVLNRHVNGWSHYLDPPDSTQAFGNLRLGSSHDELKDLLGKPSWPVSPRTITKEGKEFIIDINHWYFICGESPCRTVFYVTAYRQGDFVSKIYLQFAYEVVKAL